MSIQEKTENQRIYVGIIQYQDQSEYILYKKENQKIINPWTQQEYNLQITEGPTVNHLLQYTQEKEKINYQQLLINLEALANKIIQQILDDFNQMKITYFESKDVFYEASRVKEFIGQFSTELHYQKSLVKKA